MVLIQLFVFYCSCVGTSLRNRGSDFPKTTASKSGFCISCVRVRSALVSATHQYHRYHYCCCDYYCYLYSSFTIIVIALIVVVFAVFLCSHLLAGCT